MISRTARALAFLGLAFMAEPAWPRPAGDRPPVVAKRAKQADSLAVFARAQQLMAQAQRYARQGRPDSVHNVMFRGYELMQPYTYTPLFAEGVLFYSDYMRSLWRLKEALWPLKMALAANRDSTMRARLYNKLGGIYYEMGKTDTALFFAQRSIQAAQPAHQELQYRNAWLLGAAYRSLGQHSQAIASLRRALALGVNDNATNRAVILTHLGMALTEVGQILPARDTLRHAYELARQQGQASQIDFAVKAYLRALGASHNDPELQGAVEAYLHIHDSLNDLRNASTLALLEARTRLNEQRAHNMVLTQENHKRRTQQQVYFLIGVFAVLLAMAAGLAWLATRRQRLLTQAQNRLLQQQQQALEQQKKSLEDLNGSKDVLLSVVSHDVRGPLITLGAMLGLLAEGHLSEDESRQVLEGLAERVNDTETLLNDVLLWTKGHMKGLHTQIGRVELAPLVAEVASQCRPILQQHQVELELPPQGPSPAGMADAGLLKVVVRNVLTNAIRYGGKQTRVSLRFVQTRTEVGIAITDQGTGMSAELVQRLTEPGRQLPSKDILSLGGMGLILVKDFMHRQHGRIEVQSSPGGTTISLWLQRMADSTAQPQPRATEVASA